MRDPVLYPFYADIGSLPGVGPKVKPVLARLIGGETLLDLIFHLPVSWIDRRNRATIELGAGRRSRHRHRHRR